MFSQYAQFTVNALEAMQMNKPSAEVLELDIQGANTTRLKTTVGAMTLSMQTSAGIASILFQDDRLELDKKTAYSFDTALDPLLDQDLIDLATAKRLFTAKTADAALDMNGY